MFLFFLLSTVALAEFLLSPGVIIRVIFLSLLLANVRAIWLSFKLPAAPKAYQERLAAAGFSDRLPKLVWPWLRWVFYVWTIPWIGLTLIGMIYVLAVHR